jgi:hypothetical protein
MRFSLQSVLDDVHQKTVHRPNTTPEERLKQIGREQAEGRLASQQITAARDGTAAGTLGALKATQKATGMAFVVHKT